MTSPNLSLFLRNVWFTKTKSIGHKEVCKKYYSVQRMIAKRLQLPPRNARSLLATASVEPYTKLASIGAVSVLM